MEEEKGKTNRKDKENNADENKTQSISDQASSDQLSNEEGATVEKRGRGRPRKDTLTGKKGKILQIVIDSNIIGDEMEEEDVFLTPTVKSSFSYSPKKAQKSRTKSSISNTTEAEDNEDNGNDDTEKTKK